MPLMYRPTSTMKNFARNTDIESLRAIAVIGVVVFHMQGNLFHPGLLFLDHLFKIGQSWWGVDLFFAISGFVIARSLLPQLAAAENDRTTRRKVITAFWIRRAWRLLPSAWLWLALMLLASALINKSGAFQSVQANVMATFAGLFNVANFRYADCFFRYPYGSSFVYWSLSLEEQFYVLLPLLALCTRRYLPLVLIMLLAIQMPMHRTPWLMAFRTDALGLGVLLAIASRFSAYTKIEPRFLAKLPGVGSVVLTLLLALMSIFTVLNETHSEFTVGGMAIISTLLVWIASYDRDYLIPASRLKPVLVWIGNRSYAIYLCHIPIYLLLREVCFRYGSDGTALHPPVWLLTTLAIFFIAAVAELNFRYIEQPLRQHGRHVAKQFVVGGGQSDRPEIGDGQPIAGRS